MCLSAINTLAAAKKANCLGVPRANWNGSHQLFPYFIATVTSIPTS